jgi:uncharacterized membrane protein YecN with MAPEG domain
LFAGELAMNWVNVVVVAALVQYFVFGALVGRARGKYGVKAPAVSGNELFERYFRVHQNTLEQLIVFIPAIWMFGYYVSGPWGAALGAVFLIGRTIYATTYIRSPDTRSAGFGLTFLPVAVLIVGALIGIIRALVVS